MSALKTVTEAVALWALCVAPVALVMYLNLLKYTTL